MKTIVTGAALLGLALAVPALAAPGQCSVTGYDTFECDVSVDGGGLTFGLPDGQIFAFALVAADEGLGYRIAADAAPGQRPVELGTFRPVEGEPGCWLGERDGTKFCAALVQ
jgi:hypothetical protein